MKKIILMPALALLSGALMLFSSCSKHDENCGAPLAQNQNLDKKIRDVISKIPHFRYKSGGPGNSTSSPSTFNFASPNSGFNFSASPDGISFSTHTGDIFVSSGSFGASTGGTVVAGSTSLDINYTFCFTASDTSSSGANLFDLGNGGFNGVSSVVGVSGDFSQLASATDSTDFGDIFHGLAFYVVYDDKASGSYDIIDWTDVNWTDSTSTSGNAFAFAFDFKKGALYVSSGGKISVTGGSMNFNGEYLEISGFFDSDFDINGHLTYKKVSGFGTMGCN